MQDVFAERAARNFSELLDIFLTCIDSPQWREEQAHEARDWVGAVRTPLKKGCAKYAKAVASLTGSPACAYHAVGYRDADAVHKTCEAFQLLDFPARVARMSDAHRALFWRYLDELTASAFAAVQGEPPRVPTPSEISADILKRKGPRASGPVLKHGLKDLWRNMCGLRGVAPSDDVDAVSNKLFELSVTQVEGVGAIEAIRAKTFAAGAAFLAAFPELGDHPMHDEEWGVAEKLLSISTMEKSIPSHMMKGIEKVATELAADISSGKTDLSNLDVEAIGQRVLFNVSPEEMGQFTNNLDKIIPAIQGIGMP